MKKNKTLKGGFYVTKNDALLFVCGDDKVIFAACNAWDNEHKGTLALGLAKEDAKDGVQGEIGDLIQPSPRVFVIFDKKEAVEKLISILNVIKSEM